MIKKERLPFVALAIASLLVGLIAGLIRIGWRLPMPNVVPHHGAIMVGGFLGTLISLEKIIPLKKRWLYLIPVTSAMSVLLFIVRATDAALLLLTLASFAMVAVTAVYLSRMRNVVYIVMLAGSLAWLIGNLTLWVSGSYPLALGWWMGYALFIIVSERMELMKFLPVSKSATTILLILIICFASACALSFHGLGRYVSSISLAAIALWLLRYEVLRILLNKTGQPRFMGIALLCGYFCLLLTAIFMLVVGGQLYSYDIIVHLFFIGFVFSMIFAHGPVILPGVLGISHKPFGWPLYIWLFCLHGSLIARVVGDIAMLNELRMQSALLTTMSIIAYFITIIVIFNTRRTEPEYA